MRHLPAVSAVAFAATLGVLAAPPPAQGANARNPYGNVNPRNDAGNETGNWQTDRLNDAQLGRGGYPGPYYPASPPPPPRYAPPPRYYPPPGYYPPPPAYYYPPPGYYPRY